MHLPREIVSTWAVACLLCVASCERKTSAVTESLPPRRDAGTPATGAERGEALRAASLPTVVFLGDSIAAGLHLPADQAFPAVVARRLAGQGTPFVLRNAGVSGDTTAGGLRRVDWLLKQDPDVVVVELGANDGLRGLPLADVEQNLSALITRIEARGARVLLLGMRIPTSYGEAYATGLEAIYPRLARQHQVAFVPFFMQGVAGVAERNLPDGLHPTREGHELLAAPVAAALAPLLRALSTRD